MQRVNIVIERKIVGVSPLVHEIAIVDNPRPSFLKRLRDSFHQKVWHDAAVMIPRTDDDEISRENSSDRFWIRLCPGLKIDSLDTNLLDIEVHVDRIFPADHFPIPEFREKMRVVLRHRNDAPPHLEDIGCFADRRRKVAGHFFECRKEQITKTVPVESSFAEPVTHEFAHNLG